MEGGLRIAVGRPLERAAEGEAEAASLDAARQAWHTLQRAAPRGLIRPDAPARLMALEEAMGQRLAALLESSRAPWQRLWQRLGEAWSAGETALLYVDAEDPEHRALPWELLAESADGPILASSRTDLRVLRLGPGLARPATGQRIRLVIWALDPADPAVRQAIDQRIRAAGRAGVEVARLGPSEPPPPEQGVLDLLVVLAHGRVSAETLEILGGGGPHPPGAPIHALLAAIGQSTAVILEVCEAAAPGPTLWHDLAHRALHAGAGVVLAPRRPALLETLDAFTDALLLALSRGAPWSAAVGRAHQAVAALALALPDARWWTIMEHRAGLADAEPLTLERGPLAGLGRAHPEVLALLRAALGLAEADGRGFLGLEHLGLAAAAAPRLAGRRAGLGAALLGLQPTLQAQIYAFEPTQPVGVRLTPRLAAALAEAPDGDLDALWARLIDCGGPLDLLAPRLDPAPQDGQTLGSTVGEPRSTHHAPRSAAPPAALEVVGGPEDGRRITLAPGQTLGRWHPTGEHPDIALFQGCGCADMRVSKVHLRWLGPGSIRVARGATRTRRGTVDGLPAGAISLANGDLLSLGKGPGLLLRAEEGL